MDNLSILIVEDNFLIAEDLHGFVTGFGHEVVAITGSKAEALAALKEHTVDLALVDIMLRGEGDGIDLASELANKHVPFLFVTSHGDPATVDRAVDQEPMGYLLKPFNKATIYSALELAKKKIASRKKETIDFFVISHYKTKLKIPIDDMLFFKASNNYVELHTVSKRHVFVSTLRKVEADLPPHRFVRVHKSYLVNFEKIDGVEAARIRIANQYLPVGKTFLTALRTRLRL